MTKFVTIACNTLFVAAAMTASVPAFAEGVPTINVSYEDLNLASPADQQLLRHRIAGAARRVCEKVTDYNMIDLAHMDCIKQAMIRANAQFEVAVGNAKVLVAKR